MVSAVFYIKTDNKQFVKNINKKPNQQYDMHKNSIDLFYINIV